MKATYERAMRDKNVRDELVKPHDLDAGQWVLVRHENPQKFESKWYGLYQIVERMMLGTYRVQDPSGKELAALVHNRLVPAAISNADQLKELWASPRTKDALRRNNIHAELILADEENTKALEQHLLEADADDSPPLQEADTQVEETRGQDEPRFVLRLPVKRTYEQVALEKALDRGRKVCQKRRHRATPSST